MVNAVLGRSEPARQLGCLEDEGEVELLSTVGDVDDTVALELLETVVDGGHVGRIVGVPAIRLLDDQGVLDLGDEDDLGALVHLHDALGLELGDNLGDHRVVERLAHLLDLDV